MYIVSTKAVNKTYQKRSVPKKAIEEIKFNTKCIQLTQRMKEKSLKQQTNKWN